MILLEPAIVAILLLSMSTPLGRAYACRQQRKLAKDHVASLPADQQTRLMLHISDNIAQIMSHEPGRPDSISGPPAQADSADIAGPLKIRQAE